MMLLSDLLLNLKAIKNPSLFGSQRSVNVSLLCLPQVS